MFLIMVWLVNLTEILVSHGELAMVSAIHPQANSRAEKGIGMIKLQNNLEAECIDNFENSRYLFYFLLILINYFIVLGIGVIS